MPKPMPELRKFLDERDMAQGDLAEALGYTSQYVNAVCCGRRPVSYELIGRFLVTYDYETVVQVLGPHFPKEKPHVRA